MARRKQAVLDWRKEASAEDLKEYDAFGPWIDPVRSAADMPRAFRNWYPALAGSRFLLKVPQDVDRAQARPGQNLYRAVLAVGEEGITLLVLGAAGVTETTAAWSQVVGVRSHVNLLLSRWTVLTTTAPIGFDHSSVGAPTMAAVTDYVRSQLAAAGEVPDQVVAPVTEVVVKDDLLRTRLAQLTRNATGPVVALHSDPKNRPCRGPNGRRGLSTGAVLAAAPTELVILTRGEPVRHPFLANYAYSQTQLSYRALRAFSFAPATGRSSFGALRLLAGDAELSQPCLSNPDAVRATLLARGVPEEP